MRAELRDLTFSAKGKQILSLTLEGDFREKFDELNGKPLEVEIKRYRQKRSKNANDYLWTLCTKIAENQGISPKEVYRKQIREVGVFEPLPVKEEALERFSRAWGERGIGWFTVVVDDSFPGFKKVFAYYGSSTYNTEEMSRLINNTIEDAKALGIETATPAELSLLLDTWNK